MPPGQSTPTLTRRFGWGSRILFAVGVVILLVAALWTPIAVPALVKFPTSTNVHILYSGTMTTYVNAKTGSPLASPAVTKLSIDQHLQAIPAKSSSSVALVKETITVRAGGLTSLESNVYTLNRRTMAAVSDPREFTYVPGNTINRDSSYYVTLPMGLTSTTKLPFWYAPAGSAYLLHPLAAGISNPSSLDGLAVMWFAGNMPMTPAPAYERAALASQGLPMSLTPAQVEAQLGAAGVSEKSLATALLPALSKSELTTLLAVLSKPVALQYFVFGASQVAGEPRTGTIVKLQNLVDGVAVRLDPAPLRTVTSILSRHTNVPGVSAAAAALTRIEKAPPQNVSEFRYTQTSASVASIAKIARNQINQMNWVTRYIPIGLGVLGLILVALAMLVGRGRRRRMALAVVDSTATGSPYHQAA